MLSSGVRGFRLENVQLSTELGASRAPIVRALEQEGAAQPITIEPVQRIRVGADEQAHGDQHQRGREIERADRAEPADEAAVALSQKETARSQDGVVDAAAVCDGDADAPSS